MFAILSDRGRLNEAAEAEVRAWAPASRAEAEQLLRRNLLVFGAGGVVAPFVGIKVIDLALGALRLI